MSNVKSDIKKGIDKAAEKTKDAAGAVVDKTKDAAHAVGDSMKKAGDKVKNASK